MSNVNISDLAAVSGLNSSDLVEVLQGGINKRATIAQMQGSAQGASVELTGLSGISGLGLVIRTAAGTYVTTVATTLAKSLLSAADAATMQTLLGLGTAAPLNVPSTGNATSGQVVLGSDTRLTNSRTPTAHKSSHTTGGSDALAASDIGAAATVHTHTLNQITDAGTAAAKNTPLTGVNATSIQAVMGDDTRLTDSRTPSSHTHTLSQITDAGTAAAYNAPTIGSNATGLQLVRGDDTRLTISAIAPNAVATTNIQRSAVTYSRIQDTSTGDVVLGRDSTGAGNVKELACTASGRAFIAATSAEAQLQLLSGSAVRFSAGGFIQLKNKTTGLWHSIFADGADGDATLAVELSGEA